MVVGREESLPPASTLEHDAPPPEELLQYVAAVECKGNFMFDPVCP